MAVQNPIKPELIYSPDSGDIIEDYEKPLEKLIEEYRRSGWLPYQIGVWCTSYARLELERGLHTIPADAFLYTDTDSIKYIGDYDKEFEELNKRYRNIEYSALDKFGVRHYMGVFEKDNDKPILQFKTMGAKKYCYTDADGLHLTLAGVGKKSGAEELKTIDNFKTGFIFTKSAGSESVYNDQMQPIYYNYEGRDLYITSNLYLHDSEYTLDLDFEYNRLLSFLSTTDIRYSLHYER